MALVIALMLGGCSNLFNLQLFVVGEQTSLEKQVLGSYAGLGEDLQLYASVRGVDENGQLKVPPETTPSLKAAFQSMRNREYNRDDVDRVLVAGQAGEGNEGLLVPLKDGGPVENLAPELVAALITEENTDRAAILKRLVETAGAKSEEDRAQVARIFAELNRDAAPAGAHVQDEKGEWNRK